MFKKILSRILKKPIKLMYYSSLKKIIAEDKAIINKHIVAGQNCSIDPSAILTCLENGIIELEGDNYIGRNVEIGTHDSKIFFGFNTSIQDRCIILGDIEIGRHCVFAPNVYLSSGRHHYNFKPEFYIKDQDLLVRADKGLSEKYSKKIIIEDDCWLGINVVVMSGIKIGKGSVIGANSVVTKNVEPYSVMVGSPATLIKKRLDFELKDNIHYLNDTDIPYFYSGFKTNYTNLIENRKNGGIGLFKHFSVYLKSEGKNEIVIKIKSIKAIRLNYNNQTKEVSSEDYIDVKFDISNDSFHLFSISHNNDFNYLDLKDCALIQSILTK